MVGLKKGKTEEKPTEAETTATNEQTGQEGRETQPTEDKDSIRRIIKFNQDEKSEGEKDEQKAEETAETKTEESTKEKSIPENESKGETSATTAPSQGEALEQQRALMQSIKDFDYQIKKNNEEIKNLKEQIETISKDLDDLVSLYEIVSEQMNPFVGLSKVTKQRLEALENFTKDIQELRTRIEELEISIGKMPPQSSEKKTEESAPSPTESQTATPKENIATDVNLDNAVERAIEALAFEEKLDEVIDNFLNEIDKV